VGEFGLSTEKKGVTHFPSPAVYGWDQPRSGLSARLEPGAPRKPLAPGSAWLQPGA
jgi:hypothetical protein